MKYQVLSRNELYDLVWSTPIVILAERYSMSNVGLRKICNKMGIPVPGNGFWSKKKNNKPVKICELPKDYTGKNEVTLKIKEAGDPVKINRTLQYASLRAEIIENVGKDFKIPGRLANPGNLIIETRDALNNDPYRDNLGGLCRARDSRLDILVSQNNINRALRFMDSFIKTIEARDSTVINRHGCTYVIIQKEEIRIRLREKLKRVPSKTKSVWRIYDYEPTGILLFSVDSVWGNNKIWKDGTLAIEARIPEIIADIEIKGIERKQWRIEKEIEEAKEEERKRIAEEKEERKEEELSRFFCLLNSSRRWHEAEILRNYIRKTETNAKRNNKYTEKMKAWIVWANRKADWYDPFISGPDEYLSDCDKDNLVVEKNEWKWE